MIVDESTAIIAQETPVEITADAQIKVIEDTPGKIATTIGTGKHAKDSLIYLTIKWAFISGCILSSFLIVNSWLFRQNEKVPDLIGDISILWQILLPIITLALGYAFGKSKG